MAKRGGKRQVEHDDDHDCVPGGPGTEPDALGLGVAVSVARDGHAVFVPRALGRLDGEASEVVAELQHYAIERARIADLVAGAVEDARSLGVSWSLIGWSLGTTGDAARQRYGA